MPEDCGRNPPIWGVAVPAFSPAIAGHISSTGQNISLASSWKEEFGTLQGHMTANSTAVLNERSFKRI